MPSETKRKNCWEKYATGGASAIRNTVVSAGFQPLWGVKTGTLPRNRLAFSATGGASAIRNTVVSAGFQPLWGVKTGTLPRNRLAFSATGGASAIILAFSRRCAILNPSHIQRQSRDLRVAPMGAQCRRNGELSAGRNGIALQCRSRIPLPHSGYLRGSTPRRSSVRLSGLSGLPNQRRFFYAALSPSPVPQIGRASCRERV